MEIKIQKIIAKALGSNWMFTCTLLLFAAESGYLALTSRFPMAFDEAYHFGLVRFFSHRLNPVVTSQTGGTYKFGAIIQDPSFLYHYLLSFPERLAALFTNSLEAQVIILRLINVGLAIGSLLIIKKLLRALQLSDALANVVVLVFALTPIVPVLSAQINYDNLLVLSGALCIYETVLFTQKLDQKTFDTKRLLVLACLCLFSSLVKFSFLPVLAAITAVVAWRVAGLWRQQGGSKLMAAAKKDFAGISTGPKLALITAAVLGSGLFVRFYGVNVVKYHNPIPQCNQVLSIRDCEHYYAWDGNYVTQQYEKTHPSASRMNIGHYTLFWLRFTGSDLFGAIMPLQGPYYLSPVYYSFVILLTSVTLTCTAIYFKKMLTGNKNLAILPAASIIYLVFLWARNYHDYVQLGQPLAISGRYWVPLLVCIYTVLALGMHFTLAGKRNDKLMIKPVLAVAVIFSFVYYGGYMQYISRISPVYGGISPSNSFILPDNPPAN